MAAEDRGDEGAVDTGAEEHADGNVCDHAIAKGTDRERFQLVQEVVVAALLPRFVRLESHVPIAVALEPSVVELEIVRLGNLADVLEDRELAADVPKGEEFAQPRTADCRFL